MSSPSPKSRSTSSTPTAVARRLFPASVHASEAVHVVSTGTTARRRWERRAARNDGRRRVCMCNRARLKPCNVETVELY
jgi:hypothetical protein